MDTNQQPASRQQSPYAFERRQPRFKLEVDIRVYPRHASAVRGYTVDISESGISAILKMEVPLGQVVQLEFTLPRGTINVYATVRQRSAFRYGFEFLGGSPELETVRATCHQRAIEDFMNVESQGRGQ